MVVSIKELKISLSGKGLGELIQKLNILKNGLEDADIKIVTDMAKHIEKEVSKNLASTPYKDGNDDVQAYSIIKDKKAIAGMKGKQSLYDEFGTGTKGLQNSHPLKSSFGLNNYNNGKTIRPNKKIDSLASENGIGLNEMYWTYKTPDGIKVYTQGIPAGKQVLNASMSLKEKKQQIIKKRVGEVILKL